ncbi:hypothetical protein [Nocardia carnea]|uniref:hypothetical protein n=1 Tax=Nocardia carnea TaxID=37328 RepID=UPI002454AD48|nr:hypothetical protein [Nocardia carnea]
MRYPNIVERVAQMTAPGTDSTFADSYKDGEAADELSGALTYARDHEPCPTARGLAQPIRPPT